MQDDFKKNAGPSETPENSEITHEGGLLRFPMTPGSAEYDANGRLGFPMPK